MTATRAWLVGHRVFAGWLIAAALLMRVLIPAGFMPVVDNGAITLTLCSGAGPIEVRTPAMLHDGGAHHGSGHHGKHDAKFDPPCAFAGLTLTTLAATDPVLLTDAIRFVIATAFRAEIVAPGDDPTHLRPFARGPPTI